MKFKALILTGLCAASLSTGIEAKQDYWKKAAIVGAAGAALAAFYVVNAFPLQIGTNIEFNIFGASADKAYSLLSVGFPKDGGVSIQSILAALAALVIYDQTRPK